MDQTTITAPVRTDPEGPDRVPLTVLAERAEVLAVLARLLPAQARGARPSGFQSSI